MKWAVFIFILITAGEPPLPDNIVNTIETFDTKAECQIEMQKEVRRWIGWADENKKVFFTCKLVKKPQEPKDERGSL